MNPPNGDMSDPLFRGYHDRVRALIRHLIFQKRLIPNHPLVAAYDHHLYMMTAHGEFTRALELNHPGLDQWALQTVCFRGADLNFRYCNRVATSVYQDDIENLEPPGTQWHENQMGNEMEANRQETEAIAEKGKKDHEKRKYDKTGNSS